MKIRKFDKDCKMFESLIEEGKKIAKKAPSLKVNTDEDDKTEQKGYKWFILSRNFLSNLFGENFRDVTTFRKCFGSYSLYSLMGMYKGKHTFVKEDIEKGIGVLEGINVSFKNKKIKRRNRLLIFLLNFYYEIKEWGKIAGGLIKKPSV